MIIYNVTIKVDTSIADEWLSWISKEHIADVLGTGCFTNARILKLLDTDDTEGPTYTVQYFTETRDLYDQYIEKYAGLMRKKFFDKWGNKFIAFRSVMEVIN